MKTSALSIKIDPKVKYEAQKVANQLGFSLSAVVNASLKKLAREKTISYSLLEPSPMLKRAIESARRDRKKGKLVGPFSNPADFLKSLHS